MPVHIEQAVVWQVMQRGSNSHFHQGDQEGSIIAANLARTVCYAAMPVKSQSECLPVVLLIRVLFTIAWWMKIRDFLYNGQLPIWLCNGLHYLWHNWLLWMLLVATFRVHSQFKYAPKSAPTVRISPQDYPRFYTIIYPWQNLYNWR